MNNLELIMFENSIDELIISDAYMLTVMEEKSSEKKMKNKESDGNKKKKGKLKKAAKIVALIALIGTMISILIKLTKVDINEEEKTMIKSSIDDGKRILKEAKDARKEMEKRDLNMGEKIAMKLTRASEAYLVKTIKMAEKYIKSGKAPADVKIKLQLIKKKMNEIRIGNTIYSSTDYFAINRI